MKHARMVAVVVMVAFLAGGCWFLVGGAAGALTYAWAKGEAQQMYDRPVKEVYGAALEVAEDMGVRVDSKFAVETEAQIKGHTPGGDTFTLNIRQTGVDFSELKLRIGTLGNKEYSELFIRKLNKKLGLKQ